MYDMGLIKSKIIESIRIPVLNRSLDISSIRHQSISSNVANVSTPGYKRKFVDFKSEMRKFLNGDTKLSLKKTHENHLFRFKSPGGIDVQVDSSENNFNGVNNVDIDREMGEIAENQVIYNTSSRLLAKKFQGLLSAIRGRV